MMAGNDDRSDGGARSHGTARRSKSTSVLAGGLCTNPIRLSGYYQRIDANTGEVLTMMGSPGGTRGSLLVSCKDRRASCCPACARLYERDAYHLIAAGLRGGKNVPEAVGNHPAVMLTLTAPSFGAVHGPRDRGQPCRCGAHHVADDPQIGCALDSATYRYVDQVIWNHYASKLWKRTVQGITRKAAQALGMPRAALLEVARIRFAKVAEFQRRGVVHYHAIIRIDGPGGADSTVPADCGGTFLESIVGMAAADAVVALPKLLATLRGPSSIRWGSQRDVVTLHLDSCTKVAGYVAKYATKATETATGGTVLKPIRSPRQIQALDVSDHARALVAASWTTGERVGIDGFKRWAHQFGYGGHILTKSRQYSTTFAALRATRGEWRSASNGEGDVIVRAQLTYAGRGFGEGRTCAPSVDGTAAVWRANPKEQP